MKGQGSLESLMAVGFMLLLFLAALSLFFEKEREIERVDGLLSNQKDCKILMLGIEALFSGGKGTSTIQRLSSPALIEGNAVLIGEMICISKIKMTNGTADSFSLEDGRIELLSLGEEVKIRNV